MRLVTKINTVLGGLVGLSVALNFAALEFTVEPSFASLEDRMARANHARVLEAIDRLEQQYRGSARDYAAWDDTYEFVVDRSPAYIQENVTTDSFASLQINFFVIAGTSGALVVNRGFDFSGDKPVETQLFDDGAKLSDAVLQAARGGPGAGLLESEHGLVALGFSPVVKSDLSGEPRGVMLLGSVMDLDAIRNTTKVDFDIKPAPSASAGKDVALTLGDDVVLTSSTLFGVDGSPVGELVSSTPRSISELGQNTIRAAMMLVAAAGALILIALAILLRRIAVTRIERMRGHLTEVGATGSLSALPDDPHGDELSDMTRSFNAMAAQLAELRERLRQQDYREGAADHAAGVLHNVRNGISPIGAVVWSLTNAEGAQWKESVRKALAELKSEDPDPDRVRKLQGLVNMSAERMLVEGEQRKRELDSMRDMLRQLDEVLASEDTLSQRERTRESVDVVAAIRNAASLAKARPAGTGIDVETPAHVPAVLASDVSLTQVFGNLFVNAAEAIEATGRGSGHISVSVAETTHRGAPALDISVSDDGEGIDPALLERIFEKGFSTRRARSGGLGLHWSANAINAMGGRIYAESAGPGHGATIHVVLPRAAAPIAEAA